MPYPKGEIPPGIKRYQDERRQLKEEREGIEEPALVEEIAAALPKEVGAVLVEFQKAALEKDAARALDALKNAMGGLSAETVSQLINTPTYRAVVERARRADATARVKPGDPIRDADGKIVSYQAWRYEDYRDEEQITFQGDRNAVFHFNGLRFLVGEGIKTTLPASVYQYWLDITKEQRLADRGDGAFNWLMEMSGGKASRSVGFVPEQPIAPVA